MTMTKQEAISMAEQYAAIVSEDDHIRTMPARMASVDFDEGKVMRWLGWIQGTLQERGVFSLEELKEYARMRQVPGGPPRPEFATADEDSSI